jgi:hypothetical protein
MSDGVEIQDGGVKSLNGHVGLTVRDDLGGVGVTQEAVVLKQADLAADASWAGDEAEAFLAKAQAMRDHLVAAHSILRATRSVEP